MPSAIKPSVSHTPPFPCLTSDQGNGKEILFADWDGWDTDKDQLRMWRRVLNDVRHIWELLPEAGKAVLYRSGHGFHAVWENPVKREDAIALLQLMSEDRPGYCGQVYSEAHSCGYICGGFFQIWLEHGGMLRVGRKYGRGPDIFRITPRRKTESMVVALHDAMVKHFNHRGRPYGSMEVAP